MSIADNIKLKPVDTIFNKSSEKVTEISISLLANFKDHPFKVINDEKMADMIESIKKYGVVTPIIIRPKGNMYEIVSGHRRKFACEQLEIEKIPAIIKNLDDDEATIFMIDSNIQREEILPSERAFAYKMKLKAMKRQGKRTDLTLSQVGTKLRTDEQLAEEMGESRNQIQRFIRLTNLIT